ncbi:MULTISPECIES: esterase/lipase family protein [Enterobacter]|uniref:esterase/lipase family protein n=1 Tax=Enterobacter TaxID=547 RepID=UPI0032B5E725
MTLAAENEIVSRPEYDENGRVYYSLPNGRAEDNLVVACPKVAEKVIPVIFLPGVMGTNLKKIKSPEKVWHADMFQGSDALAWLYKSKEQRKALLDPLTTEVDLTGKVLYDDLDGRGFPSRAARGWGSALYKSYGEPLHVLQCMLNDGHILIDNLINGTSRRTPRQLLIGKNLGAEKGEDALTESEVRRSYDYLFPVHVFGYNWLQSNADSAAFLERYISETLGTYHGRLATNKVILVTHSMGGLVARHYSEQMNGRDNILGIVHGVMPDLGSPAAYRRMKTGERDIVGAVIGADAANLMPVLAQSPGPLQLLPGKAYGPGWLKIKGGTETAYKPESDPYTEIYLNESDWWRLCEKGLLLDDVGKGWKAYQSRIKKDVQKFIENLNGKYHPNTYAFYGASEKYPSDDHLIWQQIPAPRPVMGVPLELPVYRQVAGNTFELTSSGSAGDGTVPVRAGRIRFSGIRSLLATEVDHEGAYAVGDTSTENGLSVAIKFTLRSIIKMTGEVTSCR